jgi:hypothetical protein
MLKPAELLQVPGHFGVKRKVSSVELLDPLDAGPGG